MADGYTGKTDTFRTPLIKSMHKTPYPGIDPLRPELSQAGRTVLIAGGSTGIGFAIARAFVQAKASRVIIIGRRKNVVEASAAKLQAEAADQEATLVTSMMCDMSDLADTARLWDFLKTERVFVDVLVLNAAVTGKMGPILQNGLGSTWGAYEFNVRTILDFTEHFYKQEGKRQKYLVNVSTSAVHNFASDATQIPAYGLTKNAGALLLQQIAKDTDVNDMQIVSYHPGGVRTEMAIGNGVPEDALEWDDERLCGQFGVWAASNEARFAHGRILAAHWDVDELKSGEVEKKMGEQPNFLKIGVVGALGA